MKQQINLYQPIFRKQRIVFSAQTIFWVSVGFLFMLIAWSLLLNQRVASLENELARQLEAEQRAVSQVSELQRNMPSTEPDPALVDEVARLETRQASLQETLNALGRRLPVAEAGLVMRLQSLTGDVPQGMWITRLEVSDDGRHVTVHGRALAARLLPEYLEALARQPVLSGLAFRKIRVSAASDEKPGVAFVLSTNEEAP